jgi:YggT family protein
MGPGYFISPLVFIINTVFDLYVFLVLLRFMLQMLRADFYNPVSQFIVHVTSPPLGVLRRVIPSVAGQDSAAMVLCLAIIYAKFMLLRLLDTAVIPVGSTLAPIGSVGYLGLVVYAIADLVALFLTVFLIAIIIQVVLSWISPGRYNPVIGLVNSLAAPILRPVKKIMPPIGGLDLSPLVAILGIYVAKMLIIPPIIYLGSLL